MGYGNKVLTDEATDIFSIVHIQTNTHTHTFFGSLPIRLCQQTHGNADEKDFLLDLSLFLPFTVLSTKKKKPRLCIHLEDETYRLEQSHHVSKTPS